MFTCTYYCQSYEDGEFQVFAEDEEGYVEASGIISMVDLLALDGPNWPYGSCQENALLYICDDLAEDLLLRRLRRSVVASRKKFKTLELHERSKRCRWPSEEPS